MVCIHRRFAGNARRSLQSLLRPGGSGPGTPPIRSPTLLTYGPVYPSCFIALVILTALFA